MSRLARGAAPWISGSALLVAAFAAGALLADGWARWVLAALAAGALVLLAFFLQFFRDPERPVADGVVSPADGVVVRLDQVEDEDLGTVDRVAIFMSPKDVHVNRFPLAGRVVSVTHRPGGHIPAFNKDAHRNERVETMLDTDELGRVKVIQIAGTVARRIVPYVAGGETVQKGDRLGLIRMGSRCDLLVSPGTVRWSVALKEQVYGARTTIGHLLQRTPPRPTPRRKGRAP